MQREKAGCRNKSSSSLAGKYLPYYILIQQISCFVGTLQITGILIINIRMKI